MAEKKDNKGLVVAITVLSASIVLLAIAAIWVGVAISNGQKETSVAKEDEESVASPSDNVGIIAASEDNGEIGDHVRGKRDSKVLVIEYADMQCPGCASMMPKMDAIYEQYKDRVAFVFRHYPIDSHTYARPAAAAVEAAAKQGYFWAMLSALYSKRDSWSYEKNSSKLYDDLEKIFSGIAGKNADLAKFKKDYNSDEVSKKVSYDKSVGKIIGVDATPTIVVNGEKVDFSESSNISKVVTDAIDTALSK